MYLGTKLLEAQSADELGTRETRRWQDERIQSVVRSYGIEVAGTGGSKTGQAYSATTSVDLDGEVKCTCARINAEF